MLIRFVSVSAVMTIVFGAALYLLLGSFDPAVLWGSTWGVVILVSLVLTLALFAFGMVVVIRASRRILGHLEEETCPHGPEVGKLTATFNRGQGIALVWGVVILSLMVVATEML